MVWMVANHDAFDAEYDVLPEPVQDELLALMRLLAIYGLNLADRMPTHSPGHVNMKELRFRAVDGVWRVAFAFDPERRAILLVEGDKSGVAQKRFYKRLIAPADKRFDDHLAALAGKEK